MSSSQFLFWFQTKYWGEQIVHESFSFFFFFFTPSLSYDERNKRRSLEYKNSIVNKRLQRKKSDADLAKKKGEKLVVLITSKCQWPYIVGSLSDPHRKGILIS